MMRYEEQEPFRDRENKSVFPGQMKIGEISEKARNGIWNIFSELFEELPPNYFNQCTAEFYKYYVHQLHEDRDDYDLAPFAWIRLIKSRIKEQDYVSVLDFIEFVLNNENFTDSFCEKIGNFFEKSRMAYRVVGKRIIPYSSKEEHQALEEAFGVLERTGRRSPSKHLSQAADFLSRGKYFDSVRESIHAIESIVRAETNESSFGGAIKSIQRKRNLHPAFLEALNKLYGYTSDEKGIRHPFLDGFDSAVDEADAFYIFTSSAAFIKFFIRKIEMSNDQSSG